MKPDRRTDPLLVSGMRRWPTGDVQHLPTGDIGKSATSTAGFLAEYDEALAAAHERGYRDGYAVGSRDVLDVLEPIRELARLWAKTPGLEQAAVDLAQITRHLPGGASARQAALTSTPTTLA